MSVDGLPHLSGFHAPMSIAQVSSQELHIIEIGCVRHLRLDDAMLLTTVGDCSSYKGATSSGTFDTARLGWVFSSAVKNETSIYIASCPGSIHIIDLQNEVVTHLPEHRDCQLIGILFNRGRNLIYMSTEYALTSVDPDTGDVAYLAFNGNSTPTNPEDGAFSQATTMSPSSSFSMINDKLIVQGETVHGALRFIDLDTQFVTSYCKMQGESVAVTVGNMENCSLGMIWAVIFNPLQQRIMVSSTKGLLAIDVDKKLQGKLFLMLLHYDVCSIISASPFPCFISNH